MSAVGELLGDHALRTGRASEHLRRQIEALAPDGILIGHAEKRWASITFSGSRHTLMIRFEGRDAIESGERFCAALPEHEFSIPGQLVADAHIAAARRVMGQVMAVTTELLLLEHD